MRAIYLTYLFLIAAPIMLVLTTLTALVTIVGATAGVGKWAGYEPPRLWSKLMCWLSLVSVSVEGRGNIDSKTSYMFVANHQGAYDIFAVYGWLGHNFKWMMKRSLERIPLVGFACRRAGHIMVDHSSAAAVRHTIEDAEKTLRDGMSIVIFPEGARTYTGKVGPFKKGAYSLALEFNLPLVPITIDGAFKVLPRTARLPRPGKIRLTIHPPIAPPADDADRAEVMERTRQAITGGLKQ